MTSDRQEEFGGDFPPPPERKARALPVAWIALAVALIALVLLLALAY